MPRAYNTAVTGAGVLLLCCLFASHSFADSVSVKLDANESQPYWSSAMPMYGMCGEIVYAASRAAGIKSLITFKPLKRLIEDDSNNDLGNPAFYMNNQDFAAIIPIAVYHVSLFYYLPRHSHHVTSLSLKELKGHKVGVLKGSLVNRSYFERAGIDIEESYSQASLFKKLRRGRIDFVIEIDLIGQALINELFPDDVDDFHFHILPKSEAPIAILLSEEQVDARKLGALYREGLNQIRNSGEYQRILDKYYTVQSLPEDYYQHLDRFSYLYLEADE